MKIVNFLVVTAVLSTQVGAEDCKTLSETNAYVCPAVRYCKWESQTEEKRTMFGTIGYDESSWDSFDGNERDKEVWSELSPDEQDVWTELLYDAETYNTCINHFTGFTWKELEELEGMGGVFSQGAKSLYEELGYNATSWDGDEIVEKVDWDNKLMFIGHNEQSWDGNSLPWEEIATYPLELPCNDPLIAGTLYECFIEGGVVTTPAKAGFDGVSLADLKDEKVNEDFDNAVTTAMKKISGADVVTVTGKSDGATRGYGKKSLLVDLELLTFFTCDGECNDETVADAVAKAKQTTDDLAAVSSGDLMTEIKAADSNLDIWEEVTAAPMVFQEPVTEINEPDTDEEPDTDDEAEEDGFLIAVLNAILDFILGIIDFFYFLN